jgi:hypothetical protein
LRQLIEDKGYLLRDLSVSFDPQELLPYFSCQNLLRIFPGSHRLFTVQQLIREGIIVAADFTPNPSYVHKILPGYTVKIDFSTINYHDTVEKYFLDKYTKDLSFSSNIKAQFKLGGLNLRKLHENVKLSVGMMFHSGFTDLRELKNVGFGFKEILASKMFTAQSILDTYCPLREIDDYSARVAFRNLLKTEFSIGLNDLKFPASNPQDLHCFGFSWKEIYEIGNYPVSEIFGPQFRVKELLCELDLSLEELFESWNDHPSYRFSLVPRDFNDANIPIESPVKFHRFFKGETFLKSGYPAKKIIPLCLDPDTRIWKDINLMSFRYSSTFSVAEMVESNHGKNFSLDAWEKMGYITADHVQQLKDVAGYTITDIFNFRGSDGKYSAGFSAQSCIDEGFNIKDLKLFNVKDLKNQRKYNLPDFLEFGYSLQELAGKGFSLNDFHSQLKIPLIALRNLKSNFDRSKLLHSDLELMQNFPEISNMDWRRKYLLNSKDFRNAAITVSTLIAEQVYSYEDLRFEKAYTSEEYLIAVGDNYELLKTEIHFSPSEYFSTGLSPQLAYEHTNCPLYELFKAFKTRIDDILSLAKSGNFVLEDLIAAHIRRFIPFQSDVSYYSRFTIKQLKQMGFNAKNLYPYRNEIEEYRDSGFTSEELYIGGFTRREIVALFPEFTLENISLQEIRAGETRK